MYFDMFNVYVRKMYCQRIQFYQEKRPHFVFAFHKAVRFI